MVDFRKEGGSKPRNDENYSKQYLEGRYGADPYFRQLKNEGFFDAENPYVLSMEVSPRPGEDERIVLANTKRVLNRAGALLDD